MTDFNRRAVLTGAVAAGAAAFPPFAATSVNAAAPLAGKQNAGWYRYKVGSFEVTVVSDGVRPTPLADNWVRNASKEAMNAALAADFGPPNRYDFPFNPIVVNTGPKLVVIDTGTGPQSFVQSKGTLGQFQTNLAAAGIDRNTVDVVIISHFHGDHINGLLAPDNKPAYPNAEVMVPADEWKFWMDDGNMSRAPDRLKPGFNNVRRVFGALGKPPTQYEAGKELVPGITSVATPGHTPGHTSHLVTSGSASVMVQADVTAGPALMLLRNPDWHPSNDMDNAVGVTTRRKLYDRVASDKMLLQAFHVPFPSAGYVVKRGNGFDFIPAAWNPGI